MRQRFAKLLLSVSDGDITTLHVFKVDGRTGAQQKLQYGVDYIVVDEERTTERCQACDKTYPLSEIVHTGDEVLCKSCVLDKYPIQPEDIPY